MMIGVPGIAGRRPREIEARPADGELVSRELAQHDGAGPAQLLDTDRVGGRHVVLPDLRMAGRRQAGDVDDVLDADGHTVQRPAQPTRLRLGFGS